jgi:hypothetical protein
MSIHIVIKELEKFSTDILSIAEPVEERAIDFFEKKHNIKLPSDYKILLEKYNGVCLDGTEVYGIEIKPGKYSLEDCYIFEHCEVGNEMPLYLVPFSPDGGGNHYCFDTRFNNTTSCPVVFWQHDYHYTEDDMPEITYESFSEWIKEVMIDWTLEDVNYDGGKKI